MRITYYTHKPEEYKSRHITIGSKLVGLRVLEFSIDNAEELDLLLSEEGVKWAKKHIIFSKSDTRYKHPQVVLKEFKQQKESNWGSDWVDDGV